jgi:predicted RNase H-like nuclease (RuvC/YqgF family)
MSTWIPLKIADLALDEKDKEIAALKAALADLKSTADRFEENARLKAECQARQAENSVLAVECDSLKAEVERLTKAGDAMANNIPYYADVDISAETLREFTEKWHAAKEGKQS